LSRRGEYSKEAVKISNLSGNYSEVLRKLRSIADYQFGRDAGKILFAEDVTVVFSKRTGKIRFVYHQGKLLATLRPTDGLFSLSLEGAKRLMELMNPKRLWVKVQTEFAKFIEKGGDVFAKHVIDADREIRPREEVMVLDDDGRVIALGKSLLSGEEMKRFRRGIAVKVRRGNLEN